MNRQERQRREGRRREPQQGAHTGAPVPTEGTRRVNQERTGGQAARGTRQECRGRPMCPSGTAELSPAIHCWDLGRKEVATVPQGRVNSRAGWGY